MAIKHLYLPRLVTGASISEPAQDAVWDNKERSIIQDIGNGIEVDEIAQTRGVSSVPDIYARPLTFLGAFTSEKHPLRKRVIQEWRGLLSLLALHKVNPDFGNISVKSVELKNDRFSRALKNLAPKEIKLQEDGAAYKWTDFLLIEFDGFPLGAFSPATLVYTSADYSKNLKGIKFSLKDDDGFLKPPGKTEGLDLVGEWLEWFRKEFNKYALTDDDNGGGDYRYAREINKELNSWLAEIKQELGYSNSAPIEVETVKIAEEPIDVVQVPFINNYDIYKKLLTPLVKSDKGNAEGNKSEYALNHKRNNTAYKEVVVIDEKQLVQGRILWDTIRPTGIEKNISQLISTVFNAPSGTMINRINLEKDNAIWIRPELYFLSDTLLKAKEGQVLNAKEKFLNAGNTQYLLPFRKEILHYFSPTDIEEKLQPRYTESDGKVTFSFSLPLKSGSQVEVKRVYRLKNAIADNGEGKIVETDIPVMEIFPNYLGDFWCQYFMLCSDTDRFKMEPLHFDKHISILRKEQRIGAEEKMEKAELHRISGYNAFPEGILMSAVSGEAYGIVMLAKNADLEGKAFNGEVAMGVDFGTSNTNIFKKVGNDRPTRWKFAFSKHLRCVLNTNEDKRKRFARNFFIPVDDQELPAPTTLRIFRAGITDNMLLDHFIFFPYESKYPDNVYSNIKWDDDTNKLNSYQESLIFLLMIDLVYERAGTIEFRFSHPKSFNEVQTTGFKSKWINTLQAFVHEAETKTEAVPLKAFVYALLPEGSKESNTKNRASYTVSTNSNGSFTLNCKPVFKTEGVSAGEYFSNKDIYPDPTSLADKKNGAICIDVGGGTCDYSIWFNGEVSMDASVKLSGKQITQLIKINPRVRSLLFSEEAAAALRETLNVETLFASRLNFVLRSEEKEIANNLITHHKNVDLTWLRRMLAIKFGALAFYAAHLCLALDENSNRKFSEKVKEWGIKLHWGGNAAKFINWIDFGNQEENGIASQFLNNIFSNTINDKKSLGDRGFKPRILALVQSASHKSEASGGIAVMGDHAQREKTASNLMDVPDEVDDTAVTFENGLVVGEKIKTTNRTFEHYDLANQHSFFGKNGSLFLKTELTQLKRFIYLVNYIGKAIGLFPEGTEIQLTEAEELAISQRIENDISEEEKKEEGRRGIEPIFIMEVKYLLDILSNKMK